jgi:hypothetical protein
MAVPFEPNLKCVVFTAIIAGGYWWLPPKNPWVLALLLWLPYTAMAWYDELYGCQRKLSPTVVPFGRTLWLPFKPPEYQRKFDAMPPEAIRVMDAVDAWTVVLLLGAVAAAVALRQKK